MKAINFSVDGSFITDLLRTWFWDEHKSLTVCENLIQTCCSGMDKSIQTEILYAILEGRKKFVGVNTFTLVDDNERIRPLINKLKEDGHQNIKYLSPEWMQYQYQQTREITYHTEPDNVENWEGLIAPNGDFYSVIFGGHNQKSYYILIMHADLFQQTPEYFINHPNIHADNALDTLLEYGWCATRSIIFDHYVLPPPRKGLTTAQYNRILDASRKHDVTIDYDEVEKYLS